MTMHSLDLARSPLDYPGDTPGDVDFRYHLSHESMAYLENHMLSHFRAENPEEKGVIVFMVGSDSPYADIARTYETQKFPGYDSSAAMQPYEDRSTFLYTVNLDRAATKNGSHIGHMKRIVKPLNTGPLTAEALGTGLEVVDDRLAAPIEEEQCGLLEIADKHGITDFSKCMNVTSNMEANGVIPLIRGPYSLISYKAVFEIGKEAGVTHLFAYMNPGAIKSLSGSIGVHADLLADKKFHLPDPRMPGEYSDDHFVAYCMPYDEQNMSAFTETHPDYRMRKLIANREVKIFPV